MVKNKKNTIIKAEPCLRLITEKVKAKKGWGQKRLRQPPENCAVCEPFEGVGNVDAEGAEALAVALQGYLYRRCASEEVVEEGPPAGSVGFSVCPSGCHGSWCKLKATIPWVLFGTASKGPGFVVFSDVQERIDDQAKGLRFVLYPNPFGVMSCALFLK